MAEIDNSRLKGDASCHCPSDDYRDNYDKIFRKEGETMGQGPEARIEDAVCRFAKKQGMESYKFTSPARRSVPDRLFCYSQLCFFIEFKAPGKKPTSGQLREMKRLRDQGIPCFVCDDRDAGKLIVKDMMDQANNASKE